MSSLKDTVTDAKCQALHSVIDQGGAKYLCFTRLEESTLLLCCSDGCDVWRLELDADDLETHRDLANTNMDAFLSNLRNSFVSGDVSVSQQGVKVCLNLGHGTRTIDFELYEAKAAIRRTELQNVLFCLAKRSSDLEVQLEKATTEIDRLKALKGGGGAGLMDFGEVKKQSKQPKAQIKQTGMSVINPSSKKRKAAKGVTFD